MARHLRQRGQQYYAHIAIPRPLRKHFLSESGKPRDAFWLPLGPDLTVARPLCAQWVADYEARFARLRVATTPEQIEAALSDPDERQWRDAAAKKHARLRMISAFEDWGAAYGSPKELATVLRTSTSAAVVDDESISQATEAWLADPRLGGGKPQRPMTAEGHRMRANSFIKVEGDIPLTSVTRAMISDFLAGLDASTRTRNNYQMTLWCIFKNAKLRGRYQGDNPADELKRQLTDDEKDVKYDPFTLAELKTLLADAKPEVKPAAYGVQSALQWAAVIGPYAGMRIEELAAMDAVDVYQEIADEAGKEKVWIFDVHNGDNRALKNRASIRKVPIHSELQRIGFLRYVAGLPKDGKLFPGLVARESKGGKLGARLGEEFREWLVRLGLKREKLCYHSLRHNVADAMNNAKVYPPDKSRVLGHSLGGKGSGGQAAMTGGYGRGAGLKLLQEAVEAISYPGLTIK